MGVRLEWDGKPTHVERISLPFQTVETINESRATRQRDEGSLLRGSEAGDGWRKPPDLGRQQARLVSATDPSAQPDEPDYRQVYATEAGTPAQAIAKVRPLAGDRRLRAYLATGHYSDELADARWVA